MSLSSITISGTLKKDPEKRFTPTSIPVTNLLLEICYVPRGSSAAMQEGSSSQVVRVNAWRDLAEECEKKLKAGDKILVSGRAQINAYTSNEGKKKREIEIDANSVTLINDLLLIKPVQKSEEVKSSTPVKKAQQSPVQDVEQVSSLEETVANTEEIPF